jgi:hypothetical protein
MLTAAALLVVAVGPGRASAQQENVKGPTPVAAAATPAFTPEVIAKAKLDGEMAAANASGWYGRGVVFGALTGPIGIGVGYLVAANSTVELPADLRLSIASQPPELQTVYEKAYADAVRKQRKSTYNKGGWTGFGAWVLLVLASGNSGS